MPKKRKEENYDKERNNKVYCSANRFDCIGDSDGTWRHKLYGRIEKRDEARGIKTCEPRLFFICYALQCYSYFFSDSRLRRGASMMFQERTTPLKPWLSTAASDSETYCGEVGTMSAR